MAVVIQNVAGTSVYLPFERPPQPQTLWSAIPRGLQSFLWTGALDLIAVNDDALLNLNATLPPNFGYVMSGANLTVTMEAAGGGWADTANLNLQNFFRAPRNESVGIASDWVQTMLGGSLDNTTKQLVVSQPWPTAPIIGTSTTSGILIVFSTFNTAKIARPVGTLNAWMSFWQFDLEQIRKYPINSPIPTHAR